MIRFRALPSALIAFILLDGCAPKCFVKKEEQVDFYPAYVYRQANGRWVIPVMAWVHQSQPTGKLAEDAASIAHLVALFPSAAASAEDIQQRIVPFLVKGRAGTTIPVELEAHELDLNPSDADGYVRHDVVLPVNSPGVPSGGWISFQTKQCKNDPRIFQGQALVIDDHGLSVIADLDALSRDDAAEFEAWKAQGAVFHYISASPWQWFGITSEHLRALGLPAGVLQLNTLPLSDFASSPVALLTHVATLVNPSAAFKAPAMESLLQRFPNRRFILVGGSKQGDDNIFAQLKSKYPTQIEKVVDRSPRFRH